MKQFDMIVIGLGPAGMALTAMGSEMGFNVCAIERHQIGGECANVGCIPSKGLLAKSKKHVTDPFGKIAAQIDMTREKKLATVLTKAHVVFGEARFVSDKVVAVGDEEYTAKHIFIASGTRPLVPPIPGLDQVPYLTNENVFALEKAPKSIIIIGGGAIGSELSLAFQRLGTQCTIVQNDAYLVPVGERDAGEILQKEYEQLGIAVHNDEKITQIEQQNGQIIVHTQSGKALQAEKLLIAAGRRHDFTSLHLENAGVNVTRKGIAVDDYLRTNKPHIYAVGDCNGRYLLSHAAMHQGMIAVMNLLTPWPFKKKFTAYPVPWTVFTEPEISHVGHTEKQLKEKGMAYQTIEARYEDYGAAIVQDVPQGHVRVYASKWGKIYGVSIVGQGSGEMINEWAFAMQHKKGLFHIMLTMHSFPTMGFLTKRVAEIWMMGLIKQPAIRKLLKFLKAFS
ncbi:MAG: dihydrolipoyl dehydrogenase family protein [Saezia sp.]